MTVVALADRDQNAAIGDTYIVSPSMVSTFRVYFGRTGANRTSDPRIPTLCSVGKQYNASFACVDPANEINVFSNNIPGNTGFDYENDIGISEDLGWQIGPHHLEMGFTGQRVEMNAWGTFNTNPQLSFSTGVVGTSSWTGVGLADFVTGNVSRYSQGRGQLARDHEYFPSLFLQDNWRLNRHLQLNPGLRWDPFLPPFSTYGEVEDFSLTGFEQGKRSTVYPNAPAGLTFPGDAGFNSKSGIENRIAEFSPRIGVVFDPTGEGKMTLRAGYGLFQDSSVIWYANDESQNAPFGSTITFNPLPVYLANPSQGGGLTNVFFSQPGGDPFPIPFHEPSNFQFLQPSVVNGLPTAPSAGFTVFAPNISPTRVQEWSTSLQWQVRPNWLLSASYLGSKTSNIWMSETQDPDVIVLPTMTAAQYPAIVNVSGVSANGSSGSCTLLYASQQVTLNPCNSSASGSSAARRLLSMLNPAVNGGGMYGSAPSVVESVGTGSYNGLLASVEHRLSEGFSILGNYTYGRCLDTATINQDISGGGQNPAYPRGEYGNCDFDHRHIFNLSLVGEMPKFGSTWKERIIGYWNGSGIFTASSGSPFTVTSINSNYTTNGIGGDRPNRFANPYVGGTVAANPNAQSGCPTVVHAWQNWFNPCAYGNNPTFGQFGDEGRNQLYGPGAWDFDMAIWRTFPISERVHLDFRAEVFNLFNHPVLSNPSSSLSSSTPGRISSVVSTTNPRQLQGAIKINF